MKRRRYNPDLDYCGCCGRHSCAVWCSDCEGHVLKANVPAWDRTYLAQTGEECPFRVVAGG